MSMDDDEAILELQLVSEEPVTAVDADGDRWARMEESLRQEQEDEAARRRAALVEASADNDALPAARADADDEGSEGDEDDDSDEEEGTGVNGEPGSHHAATTDGAADDEVSDEQLLAVTHKKDAKQLGKALYKRWKKLYKREHGSSSKSKKKKSKRESKSSSAKRKKKSAASSGEKKSKRSRTAAAAADDGDVPFMTEEEANRLEFGGSATADTLGVDAARRTAASGARTRRPATIADSNKRMTAAQHRSVNAQTAAALVEEMRRAAKADESALAHPERGVSPLFRVALADKVNMLCRRVCLYGPLIEAGVLQELSQWLYSLPRNEPAPFQLRTVALSVLLNFPIIGELRTTGEKRNRAGELVSEDLDQFTGIDWEHLEHTDLGVAVNSLRQHASETTANRAKCIRLLERLSRTRHNDEEDSARRGSSGPAQVQWRSKGDPSVASPFVTVQTGSEAFQKAIMKPDPRDPTSYDNYLPWRPTAVPVTNLSGDLVRIAKSKIGDAGLVSDK